MTKEIKRTELITLIHETNDITGKERYLIDGFRTTKEVWDSFPVEVKEEK
jgi:hypothetical protein